MCYLISKLDLSFSSLSLSPSLFLSLSLSLSLFLSLFRTNSRIHTLHIFFSLFPIFSVKSCIFLFSTLSIYRSVSFFHSLLPFLFSLFWKSYHYPLSMSCLIDILSSPLYLSHTLCLSSSLYFSHTLCLSPPLSLVKKEKSTSSVYLCLSLSLLYPSAIWYILSVPKFTANLYCICLRIDFRYT